MKKVLLFAGGIFALTIVAVAVLVAVAATKGRALDRESRQHSDQAIRAICSTWDEQQLIDRASPEMLKSLSDGDEAQRLFSQWRRLGPITSLEPLLGDANTSVLFGSGVRVSAQYVSRAHFKGGAAQIRITLVKRESAWRVLGFWVYGNLAPGTAAAQIIYRPIGSSYNSAWRRPWAF